MADSATRPLLFELGTEEIPAQFMPAAITQMGELAAQALTDARLAYSDIRIFATPRRLALFADGLAQAQEDLLVEARGPAAKAAFDAEGRPTKAAEGFARGQGIAVSDLELRSSGTSEYVYAVRRESGRSAFEVLPDVLLSIVTRLSFPRPMRWGAHDFRFVRPIRWIVALLGDDIIPMQIVGVDSGRVTRGHRFLGSQVVSISHPSEYLGLLAEAYVMADAAERKREIWRQVTQLASASGGSVEPDEDLLDEVTHLVEWPTALVGTVPAEYAHLPKAVVSTPMKDHQRYFPVIRDDGSLLPMFITVRNGDSHGLDNVRAGNERVLNARLADARFFFDDDLKVPLAGRVEALRKITFHEKLGSTYDKVDRVTALTEFLASAMGLSSTEKATALRAAHLSKADLVTHMVYEFPELQGIMGEEYALRSGETAAVARAISEHYMPRNAGGSLPATAAGLAVAIADKMDSIAASFAIGLQPTGSADPYGLRRQALGICNMALASSLHLNLSGLARRATELAAAHAKVAVSVDATVASVKDFFLQRLRNMLLDRGFSYDAIDAVLALSPDDLFDATRRIQALDGFRSEPAFASMLVSRNRANNLSKKATATAVAVDPTLFESEVESRLFEVFAVVRAEAQVALDAGDYETVLSTMAQLERPLAAFFDGIMVMADEAGIRENRLALLKSISDFIDSVADFGKIVEQ